MANTWWYRAAGAIGVAAGLLVLGGQAAYAEPPRPHHGPLGDGPGGVLGGGPGGLLGPLGTPALGLPGDHDPVPGLLPRPAIVPDVVPPAVVPAQPPSRPAAGQPRSGLGERPVPPAAPPSVPLPAGDLLSGADVLAGDLLGDLSPDQLANAEQRLPALLGDRMAARQPELFTGVPLLGGLGGPAVIAGRTPGTMPPGGTPA